VATNGVGTAKAQDISLQTSIPSVDTTAASEVASTSATLNGRVNPDGNTVTECKFEYGTTTSYGSTAPCSSSPGSGTAGVAVSAKVTGLKAESTYHFRFVAATSVGTAKAQDISFQTSIPSVDTTAASEVTQTSATLNGKVNPNSQTVSECKFEYGTTTAYGSTAPCSPSPGSGTSGVAVSAKVTGLKGDSTYHFRVSATNSVGTAKAQDISFSTAVPSVNTEAASAIGSVSATLNGRVNPNGHETEAKFEYGTTTAYGSTVTAIPAPGSGTSGEAVFQTAGGLKPLTTYHFRLVATNSVGTAKAQDLTFTTTEGLPPTEEVGVFGLSLSSSSGL